MTSRSFATFRLPAHLARMPVVRLLRFLTILAVLLAPVGMMGGAPAQAMGHHASAGILDGAAMTGMDDCAGMQKADGKPHRQPSQKHDCMMACAAIPAFASELPAKPLAPIAAEPVPLSTFDHGLTPEAATPPPRFA
jgi:hypothetical protein